MDWSLPVIGDRRQKHDRAPQDGNEAPLRILPNRLFVMKGARRDERPNSPSSLFAGALTKLGEQVLEMERVSTPARAEVEVRVRVLQLPRNGESGVGCESSAFGHGSRITDGRELGYYPVRAPLGAWCSSRPTSAASDWRRVQITKFGDTTSSSLVQRTPVPSITVRRSPTAILRPRLRPTLSAGSLDLSSRPPRSNVGPSTSSSPCGITPA